MNFAMWVRVATKEYLQEIHYEKKQPIHTLFEEEKAKLLYLPNEPFEVYRLDSAVLDKYGRVEFEGQRYPVAKGRLNESVLLKIHWDEVEVLGHNYERLGAFSRPYSFKEQEIDWKTELELIHKKPKAVTYSWTYSQLPPPVQSYVDISDLNKRKSRIGWLIKWITSGYTVDQISHPVLSMESLEECYTPTELKDYDPDLGVYDCLSKEGVLI